MCFSATASFIAGSVLTVTGIATLRMTSQKSEIPFAMVPLLFGVQQFVEGLIWLSLQNDLTANATLTFLYSLFSHVLWPVYIPFAVRLLEPVAWRRSAIAACLAIGVAVALYLLYFIVQFPVTARVAGSHIAYESPHFYAAPTMVLYLIATCAGSLFSSDRIIQLFGALSFATFIAAYAIHVATFFSVWCFFAALLSLIIFFYLRKRRSGALA
ncbi:MAG: hypothetical protein GC190_18515 [Alphaproteobacteria bacterium]|nr:hypothetical protein [Alphaproteobacteria bacterium]